MDIADAVRLEVKISLIFCSVIVEAWGPFHKTLMPFLHLKCQYTHCHTELYQEDNFKSVAASALNFSFRYHLYPSDRNIPDQKWP